MENGNEKKPLTLAERIKMNTERKEEPKQSQQSSGTQQSTSGSGTPARKSGPAWNFENDFEQEPKAQGSGTAQNNNTAGTQAGNQATTKPVTHAAKMASARTAVGMLDFTQKLVLRPVVNYQFKKKFPKAEIERIDKVEDANKALLNDDDLKLRKKWDRLMTKRDKKMKAIPLTPTEEGDLEKLFYNYFDMKETTLDPGWGVAFGVINIVGKRAIDIFMED